MVEWGVDPVTVVETWSDELLLLMIDRREERRKRENDEAEKAQKRATGPQPRQLKMRTE